MKRQGYRKLFVVVWIAVCLGFMFGCSGNHTEEQSTDPSTNTSGKQTSIENSNPDIGIAQEPTISQATVGVAPFVFSAALPSDISLPNGDWHCEWDTDDGQRHMGRTLEYEYTAPGSYSPTWTIYLGDQVVDTGYQEVEVLRLIDARCADSDSAVDINASGFTATRILDESAVADAVTLPATHNDFVLVSTPNLATISRISCEHGTLPDPFVESEDFVLTYYGDEVFATAKENGTEIFHANFGELTSRRVTVLALTYSPCQDTFFVLVYPITEAEVNGTCYTIKSGTWEIGQLPTPSPIKPFTAGFRAIFNDTTSQLLLIASGIWASPRLFVVDGITGQLLHEEGLRSSGFRGVHLDSERQAMWLADNNVVLRIALGSDGIPVKSSAVELSCEAIAVDEQSGFCYCLRNVAHGTEPAEVVVLDGEVRARLTGTVEALESRFVSSLHRDGLQVVDQPGGRTLLIAGDEIYAISLSTLQLKMRFPAKVDMWVVGESLDGSAIFIDPQSLALFFLPNGREEILPLALPPEEIRSARKQLLDTLWDAPNKTAFLLFEDSLARWDTTAGTASLISLEDYVANSYRSTLDRVRIVALSAADSVFLRLPGRVASLNPVYHANWKTESVVQVLGEAPTDCAVTYCRNLSSLVWIEDAKVVFSEPRHPIILPENVRWDEEEEAGLAIAQSTGIAVALSTQPSGIVAVVDLVQGGIRELLYIGSRSGRALPVLKDGTLWITDDRSVYRLDLAGVFAGGSSCYAIPLSISASGGFAFPNPKHVGTSHNGNTYVLVRSDTGTALVVSEHE